MNDRYDAGHKKAEMMLGPALTKKLIADFEGIAPDMSRFVIEHVWCDFYCREGLDVKTRELAAVSALAAVGNAAPQLRAHINAALNCGCQPQEIIEVLLQVQAFAGVPAAMNALTAAKEVFAERGIVVSAAR